MKKLSLILAVLMIVATLFSLASCKIEFDENDENEHNVSQNDDKNNGKKDDDNNEKIEPKDAVLKDMVAAIEEVAPYEGMVSETLFKADDPDEMICWTYGVIDVEAYDLLEDYVITMPSDYSQTLAILKFKDGMTEDDFKEVMDVITSEYIETRESSLFMYMPYEADDMAWALEHPSQIWRQYGDHLLVLAIYGDGGEGATEEATAVWEAIESYLAGE